MLDILRSIQLSTLRRRDEADDGREEESDNDDHEEEKAKRGSRNRYSRQQLYHKVQELQESI